MLRISLGLVLVLTLGGRSCVRHAGRMPSLVAAGSADPSDAGIQVLPVQGNIYMLAGAGGNISMTTGFDGTILVDAGRADMAGRSGEREQIAITVQMPFFPLAPCVGPRCPKGAGTGAYTGSMWTNQAINGTVNSPGALKPLRYIMNTSVDAEHTGGNAAIGNRRHIYGRQRGRGGGW